MLDSDPSEWFDDADSEGSAEEKSRRFREEVRRIIVILDRTEMVGLTPSEIKDVGSLYSSRREIKRVLRNLQEVDVVEEDNGYWSLVNSGDILSEMNAAMLSKQALGEMEWAEYDDSELNELPGIGRQ